MHYISPSDTEPSKTTPRKRRLNLFYRDFVNLSKAMKQKPLLIERPNILPSPILLLF